jgi:hypothetical protein
VPPGSVPAVDGRRGRALPGSGDESTGCGAGATAAGHRVPGAGEIPGALDRIGDSHGSSILAQISAGNPDPDSHCRIGQVT